VESRALDWLLGTRSRTWLVSAAFGVLAGPLFLWGGWFGLVVAAWLVVPAWYGRWRVHAVSGMLVGFGVSWLVLLIGWLDMARVTDLALWLLIGIGALTIGIGLLVAYENTRGPRRAGHELGREESISYFRDFDSKGPGVQEEDNVGRWGGKDG
jgi:hypothetical protein